MQNVKKGERNEEKEREREKGEIFR